MMAIKMKYVTLHGKSSHIAYAIVEHYVSELVELWTLVKLEDI